MNVFKRHEIERSMKLELKSAVLLTSEKNYCYQILKTLHKRLLKIKIKAFNSRAITLTGSDLISCESVTKQCKELQHKLLEMVHICSCLIYFSTVDDVSEVRIPKKCQQNFILYDLTVINKSMPLDVYFDAKKNKDLEQKVLSLIQIVQ